MIDTAPVTSSHSLGSESVRHEIISFTHLIITSEKKGEGEEVKTVQAKT